MLGEREVWPQRPPSKQEGTPGPCLSVIFRFGGVALSESEAWAESESAIQRAFFSYVMVRFQSNPKARSCSQLRTVHRLGSIVRSGRENMSELKALIKAKLEASKRP